VKDVRHNRTRHQNCNNRLNTAPIALVDSSQSSSSDKEEVQRTTVSPVPTSVVQPTMLEIARKQCLKKLSIKEQPPTSATKRHCSLLYSKLTQQDPLAVTAVNDFVDLGVQSSQEVDSRTNEAAPFYGLDPKKSTLCFNLYALLQSLCSE
jgi:hypothetical protein